jgi:hypothetical protein
MAVNTMFYLYDLRLLGLGKRRGVIPDHHHQACSPVPTAENAPHAAAPPGFNSPEHFLGYLL